MKYPWITLKRRTMFGHRRLISEILKEYEEDLEKDLIEILEYEERIAEAYDEFNQEFLDDDTLNEINKVKALIHQE